MPVTTADALVETLLDWDVEVVFGLPGDGINAVVEALRVRRDRIQLVQARHEEAAAFMACGYAKYTGRLGVCLATSGPGGIHLLNGLYDAKLDGQPVLAITGLQAHDRIGTRAQQDVELDKLFADVSVYNVRVMGPSHVRPVADLACRTALTHRGVAHVCLPVDVQDAAAESDSAAARGKRGRRVRVAPKGSGLPAESDLHAAAKLLSDGRRIVIMAGRGALGAGDVLEAMAETLSAVIVKPLLGRAAVPDDSPHTTGCCGLLGTAPSQWAIDSCDTLFIVGSTFPYLEYYPKPGQARCVQVDIDPMRIGLRYPVDAALAGDSRLTLEALLPLVAPNNDRRFLETAQNGMEAWWALMERRGTRRDSPMKPQVVAWELGQRLSETAIVACDSGTITTWWARQIPVKRGQMHSVSGTLASMGCALPYAIAAQIAYPERQVVAFVGDGGFSMLMADFATCVKYGLPVKVVLVNNKSLGQIKWEQIVFLGNPEYACDLQEIDFASFARACGAKGLAVHDASECGAALDEALAHPGPAIVDAHVDPHEPPMPPNVTAGDLKRFARALIRGTPARRKVLGTTLESRARELV